MEADASANSLIAQRYSADEHAFTGVRCGDGVRRDLWQLPIDIIDKMLHDIATLRITARLKLFLDKGDGIYPYTEKRLSTFDERLLAS